jgi:hypothetical protein
MYWTEAHVKTTAPHLSASSLLVPYLMICACLCSCVFVAIVLSWNNVMNGGGFSFLRVSRSCSYLIQCKGQTHTFTSACHDKIIVLAYVSSKVHYNINFPTSVRTRFVTLVWEWISTSSCAWELDAGIKRKLHLAPFCAFIGNCAWVVFQELFHKSGQIWK